MTTQKKETPVKEVSTEMVAQKTEKVKQALVNGPVEEFIALRQKFIQEVNSICVEGKDYHIIQGKKSLAKGGAEKIASIFKWRATFSKDTEALEMLGDIKGLVAFKCTLQNGEFVGEGRGAASLSKNGNDPNKTLKMAQKSAFIDAVLRASGLSDFFTQDLEDMPKEEIQAHTATQATTTKPSEKQLKMIADLMRQKGYSKEDVLDMGFNTLTGGKGGTASELIDTLLKAPSKINPNGDPVTQMTEEEQRMVDGIPF